MKYRRLGENGDYTFGAGSANYLTDREACAQAVKTRLLLFLAEWWEDLNDGLPLWQKILGHSDIKAAEQLLRDRITGTEHVQDIIEFHSYWNGDSRQYTFSCTVYTDYGEVQLSEVTL